MFVPLKLPQIRAQTSKLRLKSQIRGPKSPFDPRFRKDSDTRIEKSPVKHPTPQQVATTPQQSLLSTQLVKQSKVKMAV